MLFFFPVLLRTLASDEQGWPAARQIGQLSKALCLQEGGGKDVPRTGPIAVVVKGGGSGVRGVSVLI